MPIEDTFHFRRARHHFEDARRQARRTELAARLRGRDPRLLPFDNIRSLLRNQNPMYKGIQTVPLANITGSVGRYREFTREFMPLSDSLRDRWAKVEALAMVHGWPPVDLYKVGDVYFVRDGNHRVSVARKMGNMTIEAHVWEYPIDVAIGSEDSLDEILIRLGERNFMTRTGLDTMFPDHNIRFTTPGRYTELLAQIHDLREKLAIIDDENPSYEEAVSAWYEMVYLPTVQIIHDSQLLEQFPGRTEADLFVWLSKHRERLIDYYGEYDNLADLAEKLPETYRESHLTKVARQIRRMLGYQAQRSLQESLLADEESPDGETTDTDNESE